MKLIYDSTKDHKPLTALIHSWLSSRKGEVLSGLRARQLFSEMYGIDIDHHEYAYCLDWMSRIGEATHYNCNGGDTQYLIK